MSERCEFIRKLYAKRNLSTIAMTRKHKCVVKDLQKKKLHILETNSKISQNKYVGTHTSNVGATESKIFIQIEVKFNLVHIR